MSKSDLLKRLRNHDWHHDYSDDQSVWRAGKDAAKELQAELAELDCPFKWWEINKALMGRILEKHVETTPGKFHDPECKYENMASLSRGDLLTQAEANKIMVWFEVEIRHES